MSNLKTIPVIITLNHITCCIQILENLSNYASIQLHFNITYSGKCKTLKFSKLMICMQQMQYKAPNGMYIFQKFSGSDTPDANLVLGPRIGPLPSKILAARLGLSISIFRVDLDLFSHSEYECGVNR